LILKQWTSVLDFISQFGHFNAQLAPTVHWLTFCTTFFVDNPIGRNCPRKMLIFCVRVNV
jgi:hypothetical protein